MPQSKGWFSIGCMHPERSRSCCECTARSRKCRALRAAVCTCGIASWKFCWCTSRMALLHDILTATCSWTSRSDGTAPAACLLSSVVGAAASAATPSLASARDSESAATAQWRCAASTWSVEKLATCEEVAARGEQPTDHSQSCDTLLCAASKVRCIGRTPARCCTVAASTARVGFRRFHTTGLPLHARCESHSTSSDCTAITMSCSERAW
mmetsp:Transcript_22564/g.53614  ORF Transcript_22564/g.53614 Transcript_22564/m.53614 type:complete len:211 (+) Transcript_22564:216-848(+)